MATVFDLVVDGVTLPEIQAEGIAFEYTPIWSDDTGRAASVKMNGTINGYKWSLAIQWPPLTPAEVKKIFANYSKSAEDFKTVSFTAPTGDRITTKMYFGALKGTVITYTPDFLVSGVSANLIEQ